MRELLQEGVCCTYTIHREVTDKGVIYDLEINPYGMEITGKNCGIRALITGEDSDLSDLDKLDAKMKETYLESMVQFFKNAEEYADEFKGQITTTK